MFRSAMKTKVFVDGQEGTTGLQICERLAARSDIEYIEIAPAQRKDAATRATCLNAADLVFLVTNPRTCIIDASTAHRVAKGWTYGVPELGPAYRAALRTSKRIANPGCHATAFALAIRPLVQRGLIPAAHPLSCFSLTGYSGGGKKMIAAYEQNPAPALTSPRPYALALMHKHLPEMRVHTGLDHPPVFTPIVAAFYQGLTITVPLALQHLPAAPTAQALHHALHETYLGEPFIRVLPFGDETVLDEGFFDLQACNGTNRCDLAVFGHAEQAVVMARLDNLGKGAAGAAIQCMNIHLGLDETLGLTR
jgi:N-acetyl-gamma-glutamyl-phosphate reductase